jgi:cytochrome bd ubiquinol oxidase subunit I
MDALLLARIQFALTIGFHFLFPPTTFALTLLILVCETLWVRRGLALYRRLSAFLVRLLGLVFVLGTATGIVMEFSFGNNWAAYSRVVGDIFGAPLAAEAVFAFFLESIFLGVLVFGRERVSKRAYWGSALLVFLGAHLSGLWIIAANSWMQTPAGFRMEAGRAVLTGFWAAVFNPSTLIRFLHTVLAGWITGTLLVAAIAAWYLLKKRFHDEARQLLRLALVIFAVTALLQLFSGHGHSVQVARTQPAKLAAFEALWQTRAGAPLAIAGLPDETRQSTRLYIGIEGMLSFLLYGNVDAVVPGLDRVPADQRPPVAVTFLTYHAMVAAGMLLIGLGLLGLFLMGRRRLETCRLYLWLLVLASPLGYIACETGWMAAEIGRQPWAVYGVLRTAQAASGAVPAGQIVASLVMFALLYTLLGAVAVLAFRRIVRRGPGQETASGY